MINKKDWIFKKTIEKFNISIKEFSIIKTNISDILSLITKFIPSINQNIFFFIDTYETSNLDYDLNLKFSINFKHSSNDYKIKIRNKLLEIYKRREKYTYNLKENY